MRVLVCGGRTYANRAYVEFCLGELHARRPITHLIHGNAPGADALGRDWAIKNAVPITEFPADWFHLGKAAGPIRNQQMLDEGKPDLVVAFPGGRGTADMVDRARKAGVNVEVRTP